MKSVPTINPEFLTKIVDLANAGARIIQLRSHERERIRDLAAALISHPESCHGYTKAFCWCLSVPAFNIVTGKQIKAAVGTDLSMVKHTETLFNLFHGTNGGVWVLEDFQHVLKIETGEERQRAIDFLATQAENGQSLIILGGPGFEVPDEISKEVLVMDLPLPDDDILRHIAQEVTGLNPEECSEETVSAARGLTQSEARRSFLMAFQKTEGLSSTESTRIVSEAKAQAVKGNNSLEFFDAKECDIGNIGGMENVKKWLKKRKVGLKPSARKLGLDSPKGMLLLGVQGCGKSMLAKAVAHEWGLPLLRLDLGKVQSMWLGQSEQNIRSALQVAEAISPCVLWIDEIEKGIPKSSPLDSGTGLRVLGTLLTWMQEKSSTVFVIATANSVKDLPPELLRKGRFDEIFFVDLPDKTTRAQIFMTHVSRRRHSIRPEEAMKLAESTEGFSGAEIEACVSDGLYNWANEGIANKSLPSFNINHIMDAVRVARPLSVLMAEKIDDLRNWAATRARPAAGDDLEEDSGSPSQKSFTSYKRPLPEN